MTKIRTLIVDDEPMARERVLTLLKQQPDIEVVGECADGAQALSAIERLEPELLVRAGEPFATVPQDAVSGVLEQRAKHVHEQQAGFATERQ